MRTRGETRGVPVVVLGRVVGGVDLRKIVRRTAARAASINAGTICSSSPMICGRNAVYMCARSPLIAPQHRSGSRGVSDPAGRGRGGGSFQGWGSLTPRLRPAYRICAGRKRRLAAALCEQRSLRKLWRAWRLIESGFKRVAMWCGLPIGRPEGDEPAQDHCPPLGPLLDPRAGIPGSRARQSLWAHPRRKHPIHPGPKPYGFSRNAIGKKRFGIRLVR